MARDIPVGNGSLLVNFDGQYHIRDIYFPHVGDENHTDGHPFRLGVWVDGGFSWVHDGWQITREYEEETLATHVLLENQNLGLSILCRDAVDFHENVLVRQFVLRNARDSERQVRLFFHNDFHISETEVGDTAYFDPATRALVHYKGPRWFLVNASRSDRGGGTRPVRRGPEGDVGCRGHLARCRGRPAERQPGRPGRGRFGGGGTLHPSAQRRGHGLRLDGGRHRLSPRCASWTSSPARRGQKRCYAAPSATGACG